jgi:hypothetical protein
MNVNPGPQSLRLGLSVTRIFFKGGAAFIPEGQPIQRQRING